MVGSVVLQILLGTFNGHTNAVSLHEYEVGFSDITANIDQAPDSLVELEALQSPAWIRRMARTAETDRLSLFATADAATYRKEGLFPAFTALSTNVLLPANGATLSGIAVLDADAATYFKVTKVELYPNGRVTTRNTDWYGPLNHWRVGLPLGHDERCQWDVHVAE